MNPAASITTKDEEQNRGPERSRSAFQFHTHFSVDKAEALSPPHRHPNVDKGLRQSGRTNLGRTMEHGDRVVR